MGSCSEARKKKEKFRKYRECLNRLAKKSELHDAKAYMVVERKDKWYKIGRRSENDEETLPDSLEAESTNSTSQHGFTFVEPVALRPSQLAAAFPRTTSGRQVVETPIGSAESWRHF